MKISVIIPTRVGIPDDLMERLTHQTLKPDEIIEVIGSHLTIQRNEGIKRATGDIIVFLDDDIIPNCQHLESQMGVFLKYPDAMAVSGNPIVSMYKTNSIFTFLYEIYARIFRLLYRGRGRYFLSGFSENYHPKIDKVIRGEMLHGCCMAFRKGIFDEFKFDEDIEFGMYGEDDFFAYPLSRKYAVYYNPFAICYDNRPYPRGKQANKIRFTVRNLIRRHRKRNPSLIMHIAFGWSMAGFIIFKIVEAIIMRDFSIIGGLVLACMPYKNRPLEEIRKEIEIEIEITKPRSG